SPISAGLCRVCRKPDRAASRPPSPHLCPMDACTLPLGGAHHSGSRFAAASPPSQPLGLRGPELVVVPLGGSGLVVRQFAAPSPGEREPGHRGPQRYFGTRRP